MSKRRTSRPTGVAFGLIVVAAVSLTAVLASSQRKAAARCPEGLSRSGARCCPVGTHSVEGACVGSPAGCASTQQLVDGQCLPHADRPVLIQGGTLRLAPSDWEAQGRVNEQATVVRSFLIDPVEVTYASWLRCSDRGACRKLPPRKGGVPVTGVSAEEAENYCRQSGGRLPTTVEWMFAAGGPKGRRYPWGQTGLVCRRAVFGLVDGPCARAASHPGPDLVGSRPSGATPDGLLDMVGNVAEWVRGAASDAEHLAQGGSFRSELAGQLKIWSTTSNAGPSDSVGFRCAFDVLKNAR